MKTNFLIKLLKPFIKRRVIKELENKDNKKSLVEAVNHKIDLPKLTEEEEHKLYSQLYDLLKDHITLVIDRI